MGEITLKAMIGGTAAFLAWLLVEPTAPGNPTSPEWGLFEMRLMVVLGLFVGCSLGAFSGWLRGSKIQLARSALLGAILTPMGIGLGYTIGGLLSNLVAGPVWHEAAIPVRVLGRVLAIAPIGAGLGAGVGASSLVAKRAGAGVLGGLLGGLVSGALFDLVGGLFQPFASLASVTSPITETGSLSRALTAILLGVFVGLFIGIVERAVRTAWLRLSLGRNEGKEWSLDSKQSWIGRNEMAQIPLFGDPQVASAHAVVIQHGNGYFIQDGGSPIGTYVNGQRVQTCPLVHGNSVQVGSFVLQFLEKRAGASAPVAPPQPAVKPQVPVHEPGNFQLVAITGPLAGQRFAVTSALEVGRECQGLNLSFDSTASRRHALFAPTGMGISVTDLGSSNGTLVNGQSISDTVLQLGDKVQIGATTFHVERQP